MILPPMILPMASPSSLPSWQSRRSFGFSQGRPWWFTPLLLFLPFFRVLSRLPRLTPLFLSSRSALVETAVHFC